MEVLLGVDGHGEEPELPENAGDVIRFRAITFNRMGAAAVRNRLVRETTKETKLLIFGNADARPAPDMVQRHGDVIGTLPEGSMVLGSAPWEQREGGGTVIDAFLAETPAIFFYPVMKARTWYDFKMCWTLNLSMYKRDFEACGGFFEELRPVFYEDLAFGYRMMTLRKGIWYEPAASVTHRHPMTLDQYLDREELLGIMAPVFARVCPHGFGALFGSKVGNLTKTVERFRMWAEMDVPAHQVTYRRMAEWAAAPAIVLGQGARRAHLLATIHQMHLPLKRLAFRLGFSKGMALADDKHWLEREPKGLWRSVIEARNGLSTTYE